MVDHSARSRKFEPRQEEARGLTPWRRRDRTTRSFSIGRVWRWAVVERCENPSFFMHVQANSRRRIPYETPRITGYVTTSRRATAPRDDTCCNCRTAVVLVTSAINQRHAKIQAVSCSSDASCMLSSSLPQCFEDRSNARQYRLGSIDLPPRASFCCSHSTLSAPLS